MLSTFRPCHGFVGLIKRAQSVFADGGTIQEQRAVLGSLLLILRIHSGRSDGGWDAVFAGFELEGVRHLLKEYPSRRQPESFPTRSPSKIVANNLADGSCLTDTTQLPPTTDSKSLTAESMRGR